MATELLLLIFNNDLCTDGLFKSQTINSPLTRVQMASTRLAVFYNLMSDCAQITCGIFESREHEPKTLIGALDIVSKCADAVAKVKRAAEDNDATNVVLKRLEECSGIDNIEALQEHSDEDVYQKAVRVLSDHFAFSDDDDGDVTADEQVRTQINVHDDSAADTSELAVEDLLSLVNGLIETLPDTDIKHNFLIWEGQAEGWLLPKTKSAGKS